MIVDEDIAQKLLNSEPKDEEGDYSDEDTIIEESEETFQQQSDQQPSTEEKASTSSVKNSKGPKPSLRTVRRDHPEDLIIGDIDEGMKLRQDPKREI